MIINHSPAPFNCIAHAIHRLPSQFYPVAYLHSFILLAFVVFNASRFFLRYVLQEMTMSVGVATPTSCPWNFEKVPYANNDAFCSRTTLKSIERRKIFVRNKLQAQIQKKKKQKINIPPHSIVWHCANIQSWLNTFHTFRCGLKKKKPGSESSEPRGGGHSDYKVG
jgi:hypothetical protein